jgi:hypothetical protein
MNSLSCCPKSPWDYWHPMNSLSCCPKPPWAYWQFKNGKLAVLKGPSELPFDMDWYLAYDRSLGADVVYAAR